MVDSEDVPIAYENTLAKADYSVKKIEFIKDDDVTKVKLEFPIYEEQENQEILVKLVRQFRKAVESYDLFNHLGGAEVYDKFKQCLEGDALDTWEAIVVDEDEANWNANIAQLLDVLINDEAFANQKEYLQETRKPNSMTMKKWTLRLKSINSYLPYLGLENGEVAMTEDELVKIITRNIPNSWKSRFKLANGHKSNTVTEALTVLILIEKEEKRVHKNTPTRPKGGNRRPPNTSNNNDNGHKGNEKTKGGPRNPCKLTGHQGHDYSDCKYNPRSKNYCGICWK